MAKDSNIVHQYFRKVFPEATILVKLNPIHYTGVEITILPDGSVESREMEFDASINYDLAVDGFEPGNALEFNLYHAGLV